MLVQRLTHQSALRFLVRPRSSLPISRFAAPGLATIINNNPRIQSRRAATQPLPLQDAHSILAAQRRNRPISPHLSIYKPQITWYGSALNRITGSLLSGGFYAFGAAYLVAPLLGWHLGSASMAAWFGALPVVVKVAMKFGIALPFTFHSWNGIRHLTWDMGMELSNKQVAVTGWTVVGLTIVSSGILAAL